MSPSTCARCGFLTPAVALDWRGRCPSCAPVAVCPLCEEVHQPCDGPCPCRDGETLDGDELDARADEATAATRDEWIAHQEALAASEGFGAEQPDACDALDPYAGLPLDATPLSPEELDRAVARDATLVRLDLASRARDLGLRCVERVLRSEAPNGASALGVWAEVAGDFERCLGDDQRLARSCARAAHSMQMGSVDGAVRVLAQHCGLVPGAWLEAARGELECADCGGEGTGGASGRLLCPTCRGDGVVGAGR